MTSRPAALAVPFALAPASAPRKWWKEAVVYQIYPRSFSDSNGDGIGDLRGITRRLDYLADLGVDVLWLSPVFCSPNADNGYDVSNYDDIAPEFGTLADFDELLSHAHRRGLRVLLDLVVNHTSDEHPWFVDARSAKDHPKRDYYIWAPGRNGGPPNNWESFFKGPAWELDPASGEYYLHLFSKKQPDLNWKNPEMRREIYAMMHRWLRRGVDGFRMDVINFLAKAPGLPDAPGEGPTVFAGGLYANQDGIHEFLREMRREVLRHYDAVAVGECHFVSPETGLAYVAEDRGELDLIFHFDIMHDGRQGGVTGLIDRWYAAFRGRAWNTISLNNHDTPRVVSAFGDDGPHREASAKLFATLVLTAPGTPFLYQGEEIGMTNVAFDSIEDYRDIEMLNRYAELRRQGAAEADALRRLVPCCRDNARTPMQWDASPHAGFSTGTPWIRVNPNYPSLNVARQASSSCSVLQYYRRLLELRRRTPEWIYGSFQVLASPHPKLSAYLRAAEDRYLVLLNASGTAVPVELPEIDPTDLAAASLVIGNIELAEEGAPPPTLAPWEARVCRLP